MMLAAFALVLSCFSISQGSSICPRMPAGSNFYDANLSPTLRSHYGYLTTRLIFRSLLHNATAEDDSPYTYYCYMLPDMTMQSPIIRVFPGDHLILTIDNDVGNDMDGDVGDFEEGMIDQSDPCGTNILTATSTNVHFHGAHINPSCHKDEVLKTLINIGEEFTYDIMFPFDQSPGLYWYHPHVAGLTEQQIQGGASGVYIIEGIEQIQPAVAGLPETILIFRDEVVHNLTDNGNMPFKDLTLNYIPIYYPDYPMIQLPIKPQQTQFWRIANAAAGTSLSFQLLYDGIPQTLKIVARDGVSIGTGNNAILQETTTIRLDVGSRVEFIMTGPALTVTTAIFMIQAVDTAGDNNPDRTAINLLPDVNAPNPLNTIPHIVSATAVMTPFERIPSDLSVITPTVSRLLYFSQEPVDPNDPNSDTAFYITVDGAVPHKFNAFNDTPAIIAIEGTVEEWTIENRADETHVFHIHQLHFLLTQRNGIALSQDEMQYYDTMYIDYWSGLSTDAYPSITIRIDFTNSLGIFVYHCHLLEHEDKGMMASIEVVPSTTISSTTDVKSMSSSQESIVIICLAVFLSLCGVCVMALVSMTALGYMKLNRSENQGDASSSSVLVAGIQEPDRNLVEAEV